MWGAVYFLKDKKLFSNFLTSCMQLGILNVIEVMKLRPEAVYPIYLAAASDR